jgi:RNA polymerase sigma-70 factor (ECF subfamily)
MGANAPIMSAVPEPAHSSSQQGLRQREAELIRRICAGEKELYYQLIQPYQRAVFLVAFSVMRNEADAEDVAQDALLKGLRALPSFRDEAKFSTWLERIALNEGRLRLRRGRLEKTEPLDGGIDSDDEDYLPRDFGDWREVPSEALERQEVREVLARALTRLDHKYREVVVMRDVRQLNIAETAEALGITQGAVKTRLLRARLQLRDMVAPLLRGSSLFSRNPFKKGRKPW